MAPHVIQNPRERVEMAMKHLREGNILAAYKALQRALKYWKQDQNVPTR